MRVEMALGATSWELQRGALEHEEVARGEQQLNSNEACFFRDTSHTEGV